MEKLFIICTFDCSFQYYEETVEQWVKEQGDGIVLDYDLVKINDHKSHSFYTVSSLEEFVKLESKKSKSVILILDQVTDPQNIGSIMRSCALFDCAGIIVGKDNSPELTSSLYKSASGAAEIVNYIRVTNIRRAISFLKKNNYWIYGFDSSKNKNSKLNFSQKSVLVFGSEGKGIRELVKKECDEIIQLNMKNNLKFEIDSLNVSNATSIALHQFYSS